MDAYLLQELCQWVAERLQSSGNTCSSLMSALDPGNLLLVLGDIVPAVTGEPPLRQLATDAPDPEDEHGADVSELLLTVYVNTCRRLGMRCLFAPHTHPSLSAARPDLADLPAVLRNVSELRALTAARALAARGVVDLRITSSEFDGVGWQGGEAAEGGAEAEATGEGEEDGTGAGGAGADAHFAGHALSLTYPEHVALYTGRLGPGITPPGRARLWRYLLTVEPGSVQSAEVGQAAAAAAARRVGDARRSLAQSPPGSPDALLMLAHSLCAPGQGLVCVRRSLVKGLVRAGLPPRLRGHLWLRLAGGGDGEAEAAHLVGGAEAGAGALSSASSAAPSPGRAAPHLLAAVAASEVVLPPVRPKKKAAAEAAPDTPPPATALPSAPAPPATLPPWLSHFDKLLLLNAQGLGPEGLPSRLLPLTTPGWRDDVPESDVTGAVLLPPPAVVEWGAANGYTAAPTSVLRQIDADLRRTVPHLWPLEAGRVTVDATTGSLSRVRYVYAARHAACGGEEEEEGGGSSPRAKCAGGRLCHAALEEQFTVLPASAAAAHAAPGEGSASPPGGGGWQVTVSHSSLRRVLIAYACHVPGLGYCQGLNFVVAHALRWLGEADALAHMSILVAHTLPTASYTDLTGVARDQEVLGELLLTSLPSVVAHVAALSGGGDRDGAPSSNPLPAGSAQGGKGKGKGAAAPPLDLRPGLQALTSVTLRWFMSVFCLPFHASLSDRVWDSLAWEGRAARGGGKVLFRTALALLRLAAPRVAACKSFHEAMAAVEAAPEWAGKPRVFAALMDAWVWPLPGPAAPPVLPPAAAGYRPPTASAARLGGPPSLPTSPLKGGAPAASPSAAAAGRPPAGRRGRGQRTEKRKEGGPNTRDWGFGVSGSAVGWLLGGAVSSAQSSVSSGGRFGRAGMADSAIDDAAVAAFQDDEEEEGSGEEEGEGEEGAAVDATPTPDGGESPALGGAQAFLAEGAPRPRSRSDAVSVSTAAPAPAPAHAPVGLIFSPATHPGLVWREKAHITRGLLAARRAFLSAKAAAAESAPILRGAAAAAEARRADGDGCVFPPLDDEGGGGKGGESAGGVAGPAVEPFPSRSRLLAVYYPSPASGPPSPRGPPPAEVPAYFRAGYAPPQEPLTPRSPAVPGWARDMYAHAEEEAKGVSPLPGVRLLRGAREGHRGSTSSMEYDPGEGSWAVAGGEGEGERRPSPDAAGAEAPKPPTPSRFGWGGREAAAPAPPASPAPSGAGRSPHRGWASLPPPTEEGELCGGAPLLDSYF